MPWSVLYLIAPSYLTDLSYLEKVNEQHIQVGGGNLNQCVNGNRGKYSQFKVEFMQQKIKDFIFATGELLQR